MPVSAVISGGRPITITGSSMATSGMDSGVPRPSLRPSTVSVNTMAQVASDPVPLVVGIAISLALSLKLNVSAGERASGSRSGLASNKIMALAASMTEPPPTPITQSGWNLATAAPPFLIVMREGSGSTSSNTSHFLPAASSWSVTSFKSPSFTMFLSATTKALLPRI